MSHTEYKRILPNGDTAILFIHGILGTPNHFLPFLPLVPETWSVHNLLLDGHGKGVREFSHTSMKKWEAQTADAVNQLRQTHRQVYIAAHSMGTLLAIGEAGQSVSGMFLLDVPVQLRLTFGLVQTIAKVYFDRISPEDAKGLAAKNCCGIQLCPNPLPYLGWIPRYLELFRKIRRVRNSLSRLEVPCRVYQSRHDEMISPRAAKVLARSHTVTVHCLEHSGHFYYPPQDLAFLQSEFSDFVAKIQDAH